LSTQLISIVNYDVMLTSLLKKITKTYILDVLFVVSALTTALVF